MSCFVTEGEHAIGLWYVGRDVLLRTHGAFGDDMGKHGDFSRTVAHGWVGHSRTLAPTLAAVL